MKSVLSPSHGTIFHTLSLLPRGRLVTLELSHLEGQYFVLRDWFLFLRSKCSLSSFSKRIFSLYVIFNIFPNLYTMRVFYNAKVKQKKMCLTPFSGKGIFCIEDQTEHQSTSVVHVYVCVFSLPSFLAAGVQEFFYVHYTVATKVTGKQ